MNTATNELLNSGNTLLASLNEAKHILDDAERWSDDKASRDDLKAKSSFLIIADDTRNLLAKATINRAEQELGHFSKLLVSASHPEAEKLSRVSLPKSIRSRGFFRTKISHEEYMEYQLQLDAAIHSVSDVMLSLS